MVSLPALAFHRRQCDHDLNPSPKKSIGKTYETYVEITEKGNLIFVASKTVKTQFYFTGKGIRPLTISKRQLTESVSKIKTLFA